MRKLLSFVLALSATLAAHAAPHLREQGSTQQLVVAGKPFLILGGELGNSSASSPLKESSTGLRSTNCCATRALTT